MSCPHRQRSAGERGSAAPPTSLLGRRRWPCRGLTGTQLGAGSRSAPVGEGSAPAAPRPLEPATCCTPSLPSCPPLGNASSSSTPTGGSCKRTFLARAPWLLAPPVPPSLCVQPGPACCQSAARCSKRGLEPRAQGKVPQQHLWHQSCLWPPQKSLLSSAVRAWSPVLRATLTPPAP